MKFSKGGGVINRDAYKGVNGCKIKAMVASHYFIVRQGALLGVSDHCVIKTKHVTCPHEYIYI